MNIIMVVSYANPYVVTNMNFNEKQEINARTEMNLTDLSGWYDLDPDVRKQILMDSHPPKTVAVEYADDSYTTRSGALRPVIIRFEFTRERKRIAGTDLLKINITRNAMPGHEAEAGQTYSGTWHNVSRIRLHNYADEWYTFEFVGKNAESTAGRPERSFYPPNELDSGLWWKHSLYDRERHIFEELGLTLHRTRDKWGAEVLEYRY